MGFCPLFLKNPAQCSYFQTIKHCVPILKLDFQKIELPIELNFTIFELYVIFATFDQADMAFRVKKIPVGTQF